MAREAAVGRVVLTHLYPAVDDGRLPEAVENGFDGEVLVAHDGLRLNV
jgi:ribonuclease BN (tRNA processing enzyme)